MWGGEEGRELCGRLGRQRQVGKRERGNSGQNGLNWGKWKGLPNHREPLRYALEVWQERQDSNLRPAVLETAALPAELRSCAVRRLRF